MGLRILCSFHYFGTQDMDRIVGRFNEPPIVFADSGAFSAFTQGVVVSLDEYGAWLERWRSHLAVMANLDDLHDPAITWRNQQALEARGLPVIPVFHMGSHFDWLRLYLDRGYRYIGLGKMVGRPAVETMRWAVQCFKLAKPYGAVFHGFGLTRTQAIEALPFFSVDSSSWGSGHRYGRVTVWDEQLSRLDFFELWDRASVLGHARAIRAMGFEPEVFLDRERYHRSYPAALSAAAWGRFEAHVRLRHGPIPLPAEAQRHVNVPDPVGPEVYLVDGSTHNFVDAEKGQLWAGPHVVLADSRDHWALAPGLHLHLAASHWTPGQLGSNYMTTDEPQEAAP